MPNIAAIFDREAEKWDADHGPESQNAGAFRARSAYLRSLCSQLGKPRVLDLGCGTGWQLLDLTNVIDAGVGLDISPGMIAQARGNTAQSGEPKKFAFEVCDAETATPEKFGYFNLVQFVGSLEHAPDPGRQLSAASRLLESDGILVIIMPHPWNPMILRMRLTADAKRDAPARHYSPRQLRRLAAPQGLSLKSVLALPFRSSAGRSGERSQNWPIVSGAYAACFGKALS